MNCSYHNICPLLFIFRKLEVTNHKLSIGGVKDITMIVNNPGHVMTHDFIGCVRYFLINGVDMLQQTPLSSSDVTDSCPRTQSTSWCTTNPCHNHGICRDNWTNVSCICQPAWSHSGPTCETGKTIHNQIYGTVYREVFVMEIFGE